MRNLRLAKRGWGPVPAKQLLYYAGVGVLGALVDFSLLAILLWLQCPRIPAVSASFLTSAAVQFVVNRRHVFRATARSPAMQLPLYTLAVISCWFATVSVVELGVRVLALAPLLAKLASIPVVFPLGFLMNRCVVFRDALGRSPASGSRGLDEV